MPFGQVDDAAHHLVGVLGVDAEIHRDLDGLVELRLGALLDELDRLGERIELDPVDSLARLAHAFPVHVPSLYPTTSRPIERAEPSIILIAASTDAQLRSAHFLLGDLLHLRLGHLADEAAARRSSSRD